jgi:hypothetical protein
MNRILAHAGETGSKLLTAEHLHVLLNHLPVIGLAFAAAALAMALLVKSRRAQGIALLLVLGAAGSVWAVNFTGQSAYKHIRGLADDDGAGWLDVHMERAETFAPLYYGLAALAAAALLAPRKWPRSATPLAAATLALAMAGAAVSGWIALAGGQVRHPEFRSGPPPSTRESVPHEH